jgi:uncharacterized protein (DUF2147 family)
MHSIQNKEAKTFKAVRLGRFPLLLLLLISATAFETPDSAQRLIGVWESEEKNLQIEMFEDDGQFAGRMIYFKCSSDYIMRTCKDVENPNKQLTDRNLLGLKLLTQLSYQGGDLWDDGKIYDPNSGNTFEARIQLMGQNKAIVRGYWKYRWFGRSMIFYRKR